MPSTSSNNGREGSGNETADQAAQMTKQMMYLMPLMFGFFALSFASGLSIYFIGSNIIGIGQYALMGKINFRQALGLAPAEDEEKAVKPALAAKSKPGAAEKPKRSEVSAPAPKLKRGKPRRDGVYDSRAQRAQAKSRSKG